MKATFIFLFLASLTSYAQDMSYTKSGVVSYDGKTLKKPDEILTVLKKRESEALMQSFDKYKSNRAGANVFAAIGGFGIGWSLAELISKGKVNTGFLLGGAGAIGVGLLFNSTSNKHLRETVNLYNNNPDKLSLGVGFTNHGLGFSVQF